MTTVAKAFPFVSAMLVLCCPAAPAQSPSHAADLRTARTYDVQELLERIGPRFVKSVVSGGDGALKVDTAAAQKPWLESVAALVRAFVQPELAANEQVLTLGERWLAVLARSEQHAWIDDYLAKGIEQQPPVGLLRVEVLTMAEPVFARDVAPALAPEGKAVTEITVLQPGPATTAFLDRLRTHPDATVLPLPLPEAGVVLHALVPSPLAVIRQTAYVRDFEVEVAGGSFVFDPIVAVVRDGFTLRVTASPGKAGIGLALHAAWADLMRPIPTFTTTLGQGPPVTIQLPEVRQVQVEATIELPADHTVVVLLPVLLDKRCIAVLRMAPMAADRPTVLGR
jgi:hypothetical protein